jgi:branched-chain amino acid transport system permease protein
VRDPARSNLSALAVWAACVLAAAGLGAALPPYLGELFVLIGINALLAVSLNLVNGVAGQFSLGHAGFMAVGAYTAAWLSTGPLAPLFATPALNSLGLACTILGGALSAALAGWLVGLPSLRLRGDYLAIVTLGFGAIIRVALLNSNFLGGARGFIGIPPAGGAAWTYGLLALACLACHRLMSAPTGRALLSVREDEIAAEALGVDTFRLKTGVFAASAAAAGVAGVLFAHLESFIQPDSFNFMKSVEIVVMVVLGGMGSMSGALLAAALLTVLPEALRPLKQLTGVDLRMVFYALALILLMLFRPQGLLGREELWTLRWSRLKRLLPGPKRAPSGPSDPQP